MELIHRARRMLAIAAASAFVALAAQANAQEISESHLKAARAAVDAINATDSFDNILPQAAQGLKEALIQQNPDLQALIVTTVDEKTIAMASRRADLEREAAMAYARGFSEAELNAIAEFYNSDAGKKLLSDGPIVARELVKAADIWQRGIARDLAEEVGKHLEQVVGAQAPAAPAPEGAAGGAAPVTPAPQ